MTVIEQNAPQDDETNKQRQSPCSSNWSDYLHVADDSDNESMDQTEPPTDLISLPHPQVHKYPKIHMLMQT